MKSNRVVDSSKKNSMNFLPPSTLRKNATKRAKSFHNMFTSSATRHCSNADLVQGQSATKRARSIQNISTSSATRHCSNAEGLEGQSAQRIDNSSNLCQDTNAISDDLSPLTELNMDALMDDIPEVNEVEYQEPRSEEAPPGPTSQRKKNVRGKNKCKSVGRLRPGEKLPLVFRHNRSVGPNHKVFSRHLGKLVRDNTICPIRVHFWKDMGKDVESHLWAAVLEKFTNSNMEDHKKYVLKHTRKLWTNYRCDLNIDFIKGCNSIESAIQNKPYWISKDDWKWLVKEHYWADKFKKVSARNSANRAKASMPCLLGSMPLGELIYQFGGKDGNELKLSTVYAHSRKKGGALDPTAAEKLEEIVQIELENPGIENIEVAEKSFGWGITPKQLRSPSSKKKADIEARLRRSKAENVALQAEMEAIAAEKEAIAAAKDALQHRVDTMEANFSAELRILRALVLTQQVSTSSPTS